MFYIQKENEVNIYPIKLENIFYPTSGNWVANFSLLKTTNITLSKWDFIYLKESDMKLSFYGEIRVSSQNKEEYKIVLTGISYSEDKIKKSKQFLNSTFYSITKSITSNVKYNLTDFPLSYWTDKNVTKLEFLANLCSISNIKWHINNESKFVFGAYSNIIDIKEYEKKATSTTSYSISLIPQKLELSSNISAIEYTELSTIIYL